MHITLTYLFSSQIEGTVILVLGGIPFLWALSGDWLASMDYSTDYEILHSLTFTLLATLWSTVTGLPWSLYSTFVLEEKHGFNKQTLKVFFSAASHKLLESPFIAVSFCTIH